MENINGYKVIISYEETDKIILQELKAIANGDPEEKYRLAAEVLLEYYGGPEYTVED